MPNYFIKVFHLLLIFLLFTSVSTFGKVIDFGSFFNTYPVLEKDISVFINNRASQFDFNGMFESKKEELINKAVTGTVALPSASKNNVRYFSKKHYLQDDIFYFSKNGTKVVIYPKGYEYNPLDYMNSTEHYVVINGNLVAQKEWLKSLKVKNIVIMITEGHALNISNELEKPVYLLNELVRETLDVQVTPSIIHQDGNRLKIEEFFIDSVSE